MVYGNGMKADDFILAGQRLYGRHGWKTQLADTLGMHRGTIARYANGEPIQTPEQAEAVQTLMRQIQEAETGAENERKNEAKPFDDGKAEVQARYNPLIAPITNKNPGKTALAIKALKATLAPWLKKLADEQEAIARAAREEAQRIADLAAEAQRNAAANNIEANEEAEAVSIRA